MEHNKCVKYTKFKPGESADIVLHEGESALVYPDDGGLSSEVAPAEFINLRMLECDYHRYAIAIETKGGNCSFNLKLNDDNTIDIGNREGDLVARLLAFRQNKPDSLRVPVGTKVYRANGRTINL